MAGAILGDAGILEFTNFVDLPTDNASNTKGRIAFITASGKMYRDSGSAWVEEHVAPKAGTIAVADLSFDPFTQAEADAKFDGATGHTHAGTAGNGPNLATSAITGLAEFCRDTLGAALVGGTRITITVDDAGDTITISSDDTSTAEFVRDTIGTALVAGTGATITVNDAGDTITIAATGSYSDEQARDAIGAALVAGTGIGIAVNDGADTITVSSTITQYTDEMVDDRVAALLVAGANITLTYNDVANTLTIAATGGSTPPATESNLLIFQAAGVYLAAGHIEATEKLHIYASEDGKAFREILGAASYTAPSSGVIRDPSIIRFRNRFWVVHTARFGAFDLLVSDDLVTWTFVTSVSMGGSHTTYTWAPEWFFDSDGVVHVFVTTSASGSASFPPTDMAIYELHPTNAAMTTWSAPLAITVTGGPSNIIDVQILVTDDGVYHLFYKDERSGHKTCNHATASTLLGPYTEIASNILGLSEIEGYSVCRIGAGAWRLYYNTVLTDGVSYKESYNDLATFGSGTAVTGGSWSHSTIILSNDTALERFTEPLKPALRAIASGDPLLSNGAGGVTALHDTTPSTYVGRDAGGVFGFYATSGLGGGGGGGGGTPIPSAIAKYTRSTSQTLNNTGFQNVQWTSEVSDPSGLAHLANTGNIDIVIDVSGYYLAILQYVKSAGSSLIATLILNGAVLTGGQAADIYGSTRDTAVAAFSAVATDVLRGSVYNDTGSSPGITADLVLLRLPDAGTAFSWKGAWSSATNYVINDVVIVGGSAYIAIAASLNNTPPDATYWTLMVSKGDVGATGATGPTGPSGSGSGDLLSTNNLSDLANATTARANLAVSWEVIDEVLLGGDQVDVRFPVSGSLPTAYVHLKLEISGRLTTAAATDDGIYLEFNGDTGSNYQRARSSAGSSAPAAAFSDALAKGEIGALPAASATTNYAGLVEIIIANYRGTTYFKSARGISTDIDNTTGGFVWNHGMQWRSTAAITSIKIKGNFKADTRLTLYGMRGLASPRTS